MGLCLISRVRMSATECLSHRWLQRRKSVELSCNSPNSQTNNELDYQKDILRNLVDRWNDETNITPVTENEEDKSKIIEIFKIEEKSKLPETNPNVLDRQVESQSSAVTSRQLKSENMPLNIIVQENSLPNTSFVNMEVCSHSHIKDNSSNLTAFKSESQILLKKLNDNTSLDVKQKEDSNQVKELQRNQAELCKLNWCNESTSCNLNNEIKNGEQTTMSNTSEEIIDERNGKVKQTKFKTTGISYDQKSNNVSILTGKKNKELSVNTKNDSDPRSQLIAEKTPVDTNQDTSSITMNPSEQITHSISSSQSTTWKKVADTENNEIDNSTQSHVEVTEMKSELKNFTNEVSNNITFSENIGKEPIINNALENNICETENFSNNNVSSLQETTNITSTLHKGELQTSEIANFEDNFVSLKCSTEIEPKTVIQFESEPETTDMLFEKSVADIKLETGAQLETFIGMTDFKNEKVNGEQSSQFIACNSNPNIQETVNNESEKTSERNNTCSMIVHASTNTNDVKPEANMESERVINFEQEKWKCSVDNVQTVNLESFSESTYHSQKAGIAVNENYVIPKCKNSNDNENEKLSIKSKSSSETVTPTITKNIIKTNKTKEINAEFRILSTVNSEEGVDDFVLSSSSSVTFNNSQEGSTIDNRQRKSTKVEVNDESYECTKKSSFIIKKIIENHEQEAQLLKGSRNCSISVNAQSDLFENENSFDNIHNSILQRRISDITSLLSRSDVDRSFTEISSLCKNLSNSMHIQTNLESRKSIPESSSKRPKLRISCSSRDVPLTSAPPHQAQLLNYLPLNTDEYTSISSTWSFLKTDTFHSDPGSLRNSPERYGPPSLTRKILSKFFRDSMEYNLTSVPSIITKDKITELIS